MEVVQQATSYLTILSHIPSLSHPPVAIGCFEGDGELGLPGGHREADVRQGGRGGVDEEGGAHLAPHIADLRTREQAARVRVRGPASAQAGAASALSV